MKYIEFINKEQAMKNCLLADILGSILGFGVHTSVVHPLPTKISEIKANNRLEKMFDYINKIICKVLVIDCYTAHIV